MQTVRDASIDIARGLAISAIVFGHVLRGLESGSLIDSDEPWFIATDRAIYMVHLAVFAFTAGLMVRSSLERRGAARYTRERIGEFLWLYVLWSLAQGAMQFALSGLVNHPRSLASVFTLWRPDSQLWFFPWLALMTAVVVVAKPWASRLRCIVSLAAAAGASLAMWGFFGTFIFTQGLGLTVFFFAAAAMTFPRYQQLRQAVHPAGVWLILFAAAAGYVALLLSTDANGPTSAFGPRTVSAALSGFLASWLGVIGTLALAVVLQAVPGIGRFVAYLGRQSLIIFLAHTMAVAAARILLIRLGIDGIAPQLLIGTAVGLAAPIGAWWVTKRWLPWLWGAPRFVTGVSRTASAAGRT